MLFLVFSEAMAELTSFGTTSPEKDKYRVQHTGTCSRITKPELTSEEQTARHVLAVHGVALHHLVGSLEAGIGDFADRQLLMVSFLRRYNRGVGGQREMDARVGHQVGLELGQVDVEGTIKAERGRDGGHDLADQTVQVGVSRSRDV